MPDYTPHETIDIFLMVHSQVPCTMYIFFKIHCHSF